MMIPLTTKYRPATLDEVMGQSHIVKSFQNQIKENSVDNCILFVGPAGTGKTTIARIIANELNTEVIELDAASNNGVDNVRQIQEEAYKKSIIASGKCFIMDECVTGDTEILTDRGYIRMDTLTNTDKIAQFNDDSTIEFVSPIRLIKKQYTGDLCVWQPRRGHTIKMTPHHVQPLYFNKSGKIKESYIGDIRFNQNNNLIVSGAGVGHKCNLSPIDRLAIALQADGSMDGYSNDKNRWDIKVKKSRKKIRLLQLLIDSGVSFHELATTDDCVRYRCYTDKTITKDLQTHFNLDISYDYAREFVNEISLWDGSVLDGFLYYSCTQKNNVDFVSAVATLGGFSCKQTIQEDNRSETYSSVHRLHMRDKKYSNCHYTQKTMKTEFYSGLVYCVEVPSHKIIVRANGYTFITGNCHSLSTQAWQAFLKIIEEPPKGVYFIFCTTESQKIPATILSRVHRYNFDNLSDKDIVMELICICTTEGITNIEDGSLDYIAELSNGCMRQAIMYLDTCINYSKAISKENIKKALNSCDIECVHDFVEYVYACNNSMALSVFETVYDSGVNVKSFISDCIDYVISICRNYLISPNPNEWSYDTLLTLLQWLMSIKYALQTEENVLQYMQSKILLGMHYAGY